MGKWRHYESANEKRAGTNSKIQMLIAIHSSNHTFFSRGKNNMNVFHTDSAIVDWNSFVVFGINYYKNVWKFIINLK